MRILLFLFLCLFCVASCRKQEPPVVVGGSNEPKMAAGLAADVRGLVVSGKFQPDFVPQSPAGKDLKEILSAGLNDIERFDKVLSTSGVGAIAQAKLLSTSDGRKKARSMSLELHRAAIRRYDSDSILVEKFAAWAATNGLGTFESSETLAKSIPTAKNIANETMQDVKEWIDLLDEIKPGYDAKSGKLTFKGMSKGIEYDQLSAEINKHADEWARLDLAAVAAKEALLLDLESLAK